MRIRNQIEVWQGTQTTPDNKHEFGGFNSYRDEQGRAVFVVSVGIPPGDDNSRDVELREGDTFTVADQVWKAVEIIAPGSMGAHVKLTLIEPPE